MEDGNYFAVLQHELAAEEGSFLLQLRCDLVWDTAAFTRLTGAMLACCQAFDADDQRPTLFGRAHDPTHLPRWLVDGFWYLATFVEGWTTHPAWAERTAMDKDYYNRAYQRLRDLADWFFTGHCPYLDPNKGFFPMWPGCLRSTPPLSSLPQCRFPQLSVQTWYYGSMLTPGRPAHPSAAEEIQQWREEVEGGGGESATADDGGEAAAESRKQR